MKRGKRHCQSFSITLDDGTVVHGHGQFVGPITDRDRAAINDVVRALRALTAEERKTAQASPFDAVLLSKPICQ
jgi:hypothetical protein